MDRWVYSDVPREVKGDADALVCVVDVESRGIFCCCQIKYLAKMFAYVEERNVALEKGIKPPPEFNLVDDVQFMDIIAALKPDMWKRVAHDGICTDYECTYSEGITKENFAECCKLYNRHKNLWCELDGEVPHAEGEFPPMNNKIRIHCFETTGIEGFPSNTYEANSTHSALDCIKGILENKNSGISRILIENPNFGDSRCYNNISAMSPMEI